MSELIAFDFEVGKEPHNINAWWEEAPLGITVATFIHEAGGDPWVFAKGYEFDPQENSEVLPMSEYQPEAMTVEECRGMARWMLDMANTGHRFVSFNGMKFDLQVLAEEIGGGELIHRLHRLGMDAHYDPFLVMSFQKGYAVSLDTMAQALGVEGKAKTMGGADAPALWKMSHCEKVVKYCVQDTRATMNIYNALVHGGYMPPWVTSKGTLSKRGWVVPIVEENGHRRLATPREAYRLPEPWFNPRGTWRPWPRDEYTEWPILK